MDPNRDPIVFKLRVHQITEGKGVKNSRGNKVNLAGERRKKLALEKNKKYFRNQFIPLCRLFFDHQ